jgi:UDP-GlcNAc:undecaprenyl-phosphate GlcNAc-1-phosphate transferase
VPLSISVSILLGLLLSLLVAPACIRLANRAGMIDNPAGSAYKIHAAPTARAGGLVLFVTVILIGAVTGTLLDPGIRTIFLASLAIFAVGIWDDAKGISAVTKLCGQFIAGLILIQGGGAVQFLHYPPVDYALTLFWVIGITNAYNLVDSMDGQAIGLAGIAAFFLMLATMNGSQASSAAFAAILIGACAGLAYYNLTPARLFLGDSGSQLLGFWLAGLGIIYTPARSVPQLSSWFVPILLMIVPILDTTLVTTSRLRSGLPFYVANRDHTYHRLVALGVAPLHAVIIVLLASVAAGCLAFIALAMPPLWANAIFAATLVAGLVVIIWMERGAGH